MASLTKGIFIVAAKRTPFGTFGGKLADKTSIELQEIAFKAALAAGKVDPSLIDSVVVGNCISSSSTDGPYISRHAALRSGVQQHVPALTINRLCGSGFQAVVNGAHDILMGDSQVVLTGGSENMSQSPFCVRNIRFGTRLGAPYNLEDSLWAALSDQHIKTPMGVTAENLAVKYKISREEVDNFSLQSQKRWAEANAGGRFKEEIVPINLKIKRQDVVMDSDEHPKPSTTLEGLAKLPTVFKKDGVVTAGGASGICDGAGAIIIASEAAVKQHNLTPLARLVGYGISGCDPHIMGIGPVPAIQKVLAVTGNNLNQIDLIEVNEAFAAQALAVQKELGIENDKFNVNGGAIALGHPLAASGSRITAHLVHELRRRQAKLAIGSACIGGGQGIAVLLERV
jgi:acetyl-CoA acyltransferase 2